MPTIEKLQETWTPSSITTLFRLCSKTDIDTSLPLQSPSGGISWRLIMSRAPPRFCNRKSTCNLFFSSNDCPSAWCGAPVKVTFSFPLPPHAHVGDSPRNHCTTATLSLGDDNYFLTSHSIDILGDALVSLEVAFTNLPTRNLFDALACVGLVPDAPATGSASTGSISQTRTALRSLEKSLKTGAPFDIMFQAYTRRLSPGKVARPLPIYACTVVLHAMALLPDFCTFYSYFSCRY